MFDFLQICLRKAKPVCKIPHMFILADVWLLPNMFGKNQTRWYIYTWVLFSTHVWILTNMYGKRHTCVKKATQIFVCKCWTFSTCAGKATDLLISPWAIGGKESKKIYDLVLNSPSATRDLSRTETAHFQLSPRSYRAVRARCAHSGLLCAVHCAHRHSRVKTPNLLILDQF